MSCAWWTTLPLNHQQRIPRRIRRRRGGAGGQNPSDEIGAWLHIGEDGRITVYTGKAEVGRNIRTSLTQAVAEELHARRVQSA